MWVVEDDAKGNSRNNKAIKMAIFRQTWCLRPESKWRHIVFLAIAKKNVDTICCKYGIYDLFSMSTLLILLTIECIE